MSLFCDGACAECTCVLSVFFFFFQAEDGIRDLTVTGVQTCALPISIEAVRPHLRFLRQLVVAGRPGPGQVGLAELVTAESDELDPADTTKDDVAFWLYTSGTTGTPKAAVHLHHDMVVCCEAFGRHVLEIGPDDRCFSVARLFFAYGLGNALYFPFHVGAATVLDPRRPEPVQVFEILTQERPALF